jgi:EAL domain-containing protein (putative c-di-GMP-specific phosphodiesterase class I)
MNIKIAVDDFGTEYNNLDYLLVLKPDFLKIDGSIVKEIKSNEYSIKIIESIVILAQKLNVKTVAEFVKDKESFEKLQQLGVDYIQGYYVGKPREEL